MAPPVNEPGHPPDVIALTVTKETDMTRVRRGSREMVVENVLTGSKEMAAQNVLRGSREMNVTPVLMVTMETCVVSRF